MSEPTPENGVEICQAYQIPVPVDEDMNTELMIFCDYMECGSSSCIAVYCQDNKCPGRKICDSDWCNQ